MNYTEQMQKLITKTSIDIAIIFSLIAVITVLVWTVPLAYFRNNKRVDKKTKRTSLIAQAVLTFICLLLSLTTVSSFKDINNMKKDIEAQDFSVYIGDYSIDSNYHFTFSVSELWFDLRAVNIYNNEPLWFDVMSDPDVKKVGYGKIVYGKSSRYAVSIEESK